MSLVSVTDVTPADYPEDKGPAQVFEIIRPENAPLTLGRLSLSCTCIEVSTEGGKTSFEADERVLITVRQVKDAPKGGAVFTMTAQVLTPKAAILTCEVPVKG